MNDSTRGHSSLHIQLLRVSFMGLLLTFLSVTGLAHAKLERSKPKDNSTLQQAPKLVELWFSEELEAGLNTIEVKDQAGQRVDRGGVVLAEGNKKAQVELGELAPGVYTVTWKALSADQHAMRGSFTFTVAAPSGGSGTVAPDSLQSPATTPMAGHSQEQMPPPAISEVEASADRISWSQSLVRWLTYLAMMLLFGGFAFRSLVLVPALRRGLDGEDRIEAVRIGTRRIVKVLCVSIFLLAVTSVVALGLQASDVFDKSFGASLSPAVLAQVLKTGYGSSWILQATSLIVIAFILLLLSRQLRRNPETEGSGLWWAGLLAGGALLVAPSWTGHAMLSVKHFRLAVITDWLHLLAGGFWVGGLFHLALTWPRLRSRIPKHLLPAALHHLIRLFTRTAMPSVVLLVLAGLYNTWAHVPGLRALWVTPYGQALSVKLPLVLFMLLLGAINNYHFGKRASRILKLKEGSNADAAARLERGFYRSVRFEASLGLVVLLVTAVLVFLTPARNHPAMENAEIGKALMQGR
ncbi:MAG TPA: copper resistance protein CopC [Pyrinomonadaceae bacterium]|nr:copper resistance protein CopC [Pyrinomonadaceae bacterium]